MTKMQWGHSRLSDFRRRIGSAAGWLILAWALGAQAAGQEPRSTSDRSPLLTDRRLAQPVSVESNGGNLPELLGPLGKELGLDLQVQCDLVRRPVVIQVRNQPASKLLANLEALFAGKWVRYKTGLLLVTHASIARMVEEFRDRDRRDEQRAFQKSLTVEQRQVMSGKRGLPWAQLTALQQRALGRLVADCFLRDPVHHPWSMMQGSRVTLAQAPSERSGAGGYVVLGPTLQADGRVKPERLFAFATD
jgi:hypothetical protein